MKKSTLMLIIFLVCRGALAENNQIVKCRVTNKEWASFFILDAGGDGFLQFIKVGDNNTYTCGLKLDFINNGERAVSPNVTMDFVRGQCEPELGDLEREIFDRFKLTINIRNKDKPKGHVQWLKRKQPDPCVLDKFSMPDIAVNAKKWLKGKWGRQTASDPKSLAPRKKNR